MGAPVAHCIKVTGDKSKDLCCGIYATLCAKYLQISIRKDIDTTVLDASMLNEATMRHHNYLSHKYPSEVLYYALNTKHATNDIALTAPLLFDFNVRRR